MIKITIENVVEKLKSIDKVKQVNVRYKDEQSCDFAIISNYITLELYDEISAILVDCEYKMETVLSYVLYTEQEYFEAGYNKE